MSGLRAYQLAGSVEAANVSARLEYAALELNVHVAARHAVELLEELAHLHHELRRAERVLRAAMAYVGMPLHRYGFCRRGIQGYGLYI